jgi:hypothetical protein
VVRARQSEISAVLATLAEEWDSEEELAKALIDAVYDLAEERNFYGVGWGGLSYGPFPLKSTAASLAKALDEKPFVAPLLSVAALRRAVAGANPVADDGHCKVCTHPKFAHGFPRPPGCFVKNCGCRTVYS